MGWDVESQGLFGAPELPVIVGADAHNTIFKALAMLGLGRDRVIRVPIDAQGRMRPELLPDIPGPAIVCIQHGNVNSGAFDPAGPVIEWARVRDAWVHVDGAFGLWARATPSRAHLAAGVEGADSWATDAHKWLNVPYDSGLAFVRDAEALRAAMAVTADYLPTVTEQRAGGKHRPLQLPEAGREQEGRHQVDEDPAQRASGGHHQVEARQPAGPRAQRANLQRAPRIRRESRPLFPSLKRGMDREGRRTPARGIFAPHQRCRYPCWRGASPGVRICRAPPPGRGRSGPRRSPGPGRLLFEPL